MANELLISALNQIAERVEVENKKHYWMVRTDNGINYDTFSVEGFVALNLHDYPTQFLSKLEHDYPDVNTRIPHIKRELIELNKKRRIELNFNEGERPFKSRIGRLANQIASMAYNIKRGDIVLIPDHGANRIKIGKIIDDCLYIRKNDNRFSYARKVEWLKEIRKTRLDPCLYKALGAHQAICDITKYSEYVERNYNSFFNIDDKYHYVLAVNAENISAWKLSNMVYDILYCVKNISEENNLGINIEEINFTINVNSPGKFSFITTAKNAALIMAVVAALSGGNIKYTEFEATTNGLFPNLVECINTWKNAEQEREQKAQLFNLFINSLEVKTIEAANEAYEAVAAEEEDDDDEEEEFIEEDDDNENR